MAKKNFILVLFVLALMSVACRFGVNTGGNQTGNIETERGSGNITREERNVSGFDRLVLTGIGDVILEQGDSEALEIEAEDNLIDDITTEVRDGTLYIGFKRRIVLPTKPVKFYLTMKDIRSLETKGLGNIRSDGINTDRLDIGISGTGNIDIEDLSSDRMNVTISGAGNLTIVGKVSDVEVNLSGAGNLNGEDLEVQRSEVTITGLGRVTTWVTESLNVRISGAGSVDYYGNPEVTQNITGLGSINDKGDK